MFFIRSISALLCIGLFAGMGAGGYVDRFERMNQLQIQTNEILESDRDPTEKPTPIVYWHGMGDNGASVKSALSFIEKEIPGVYVHSIQIGPNAIKDTEYGYFYNINEQVSLVCEMLQNDTNLQDGYNAIGLSQGGQFLRAIAQRCPSPPMKNLISLGGQHQGVFGIPRCSAPDHSWCEFIDKALTNFAYASWLQRSLVQAAYWHDPFKNHEYVEKSLFLSDINNERRVNETYKENLLKLSHLILVKFADDTIVEPKESEWFEFYKPGQDKEIVPLRQSRIYIHDRIGLKALDESGRLVLLETSGNHLQFTKKWFNENILPFLK